MFINKWTSHCLLVYIKNCLKEYRYNPTSQLRPVIIPTKYQTTEPLLSNTNKHLCTFCYYCLYIRRIADKAVEISLRNQDNKNAMHSVLKGHYRHDQSSFIQTMCPLTSLRHQNITFLPGAVRTHRVLHKFRCNRLWIMWPLTLLLNNIYAKHDACAQRRADFNRGRCICKQRAHGL